MSDDKFCLNTYQSLDMTMSWLVGEIMDGCVKTGHSCKRLNELIQSCNNLAILKVQMNAAKFVEPEYPEE